MEKHCSTISFGLKNRKDKNGKSPIVMLIGAYGERAEFQTGKKLKLRIGTMVSNKQKENQQKLNFSMPI
jgi:hypothetical protein